MPAVPVWYLDKYHVAVADAEARVHALIMQISGHKMSNIDDYLLHDSDELIAKYLRECEAKGCLQQGDVTGAMLAQGGDISAVAEQMRKEEIDFLFNALKTGDQIDQANLIKKIHWWNPGQIGTSIFVGLAVVSDFENW